ncbi:MAG: hypothetical protein PHR77_18955 [Kiritimatiellae bacterium]|nr:hypothetical protein [Kiritimatiellia bacterium]MDD5522843.1 hypothetical protein [Kiritimatiellia bacterium]
MAVISTSLAGKWLQTVSDTVILPGQGLLTVGLIILRLSHPQSQPFTRMLADQMASNTPENSIIISSIDPAYLDFFVVKSTKRRIIPLTRNVEYASKFICPEKVKNPTPPPLSPTDHRCKGLLKGKVHDVIPFTASEGIPFLIEEAKKGTPIFLETSLIFASDAQVIANLQANFDVISRSDYVYQLVSK